MPGTVSNAYVNDSFYSSQQTFNVGAVLQKRSGDTMAQGDPGRKEKSQASNSSSLAPESGCGQHTQRKLAVLVLPHLVD